MAATPPEQIRSLVNQLYAAWSLHQPEKTDAIFTDDGIYEDVAAGRMHRGKEQIKDFRRAAFAWSPDFRVTMKSLIIAHDAAATEWLSEGIQTGPIGELPASGNSFQLRGASILTFRNGKIARVTDYYPGLFILQGKSTTPCRDQGMSLEERRHRGEQFQ